MPSFQGTYEDRIGKFRAGNTLIQSWGGYDPGNPVITKAAVTSFITEVETANTEVITSLNTAGQKKNARKPLCFTLRHPNKEIGIINPNCAEESIIRVHSYLGSLFPEGSATVDAIAAILKRIRPQYKAATGKKSFSLKAGQTISINNVVSGEPASSTGRTDLSWQASGSTEPPVTFGPGQETVINAPGGSILVKNGSTVKGGRVRLVVKTGKKLTISPAEKTFPSIAGFLSEVITLCSAMPPGISYNPPDPVLTVAALTALRDQIETANKAVTTATDDYGTATRKRKELYNGTEGLQDRIRLTKSYLASFKGGKKSDHFIEYSQAIKGT